MYFTQEDLEKIAKGLEARGKKDTLFSQATLPLDGNELIAVILEDKNAILTLAELIALLSNYVLIKGYSYVGVATPSTTPIEHSHGVFYIASEAGEYQNFGGVILDGTQLVIFKSDKDNTIWETDFLGVRLDAILIAEDAKLIADKAIAIADKFQNDLLIVKDQASSALANASVALEQSNKAWDKASTAILISDRGKPGGVPILDENGKVPLSLLPLTKTELIDSYLSDDTTKAPTAAALHRLYLYHEEDIVKMTNILNAILDLVSDSSEIGVAPVDIKITSAAQDVKVQVICNGSWNITEIPQTITATPVSGTGNSVITLSFPANPSLTDDITGVIKVTNSYGKEKSVNFTQYSASTRYMYDISVVPPSVEVTPAPGSGRLEVTSTKTPYINDTPSGDPEEVPFTISIPSEDTWLELDAEDSSNYTYKENTLEAARSSKFIIVQTDENGKTIEVPITQSKALVNTVYKFEVEPKDASITDNGSGKSYPIKITSQKTVTINETSTTTDVDYNVSYTGDASTAWVTYSKEDNTVTISVNEDKDRTGAIVFTLVSPESPKITVPIVQNKADIKWSYTFDYSPELMQFGNAAGSKTYSVTKSIKLKTINGVPSGDEIYVDWDVTLDSEDFILDKDASSVSVGENTSLNTRTASLIFTRAELGEEGNKVVNITQAAGIEDWSYAITASINPTSVAASNATTVLTVTSTKQKLINGKPSGDLVQVAWHGTSINGLLTGADTSGSTWTMQDNRTESAREDTITINQLESSGKSTQVKVSQVAGQKVYTPWSAWNITLTPSVATVAASGGTSAITASAYRTRTWTWNGKGETTTDRETGTPTLSKVSGNGTLSGSTVTFANNTSTSALECVVKATLGSDTKNLTILQSAGSKNYTRYSDLTFQLGVVNPNFNASGGSTTVNVNSASRKHHYKWNNTGDDNSYDMESGTPTLSISGAGYSLSGTTITASNNTTTSTRLGILTSNIWGSTSDNRYLGQAAGAKQYSGWTTNSVTVSFNSTSNAAAAGETRAFNGKAAQTRTWTWNGVAGSGGTENQDVTSGISYSASGGTVSGSSVVIPNNTTTSTKSITVTGSKDGKSGTSTITQTAGSKVYGAYYESSVTPNPNSNISNSAEASEQDFTAIATTHRDWTWNGVSGTGGTEESTVNQFSPNNENNYVYPHTSASWLTFTTSKGSTRANLGIAANTGNARTGTIYFDYKAPNGDSAETMALTVSQEAGITDGTTFNFNFTNNTDVLCTVMTSSHGDMPINIGSSTNLVIDESEQIIYKYNRVPYGALVFAFTGLSGLPNPIIDSVVTSGSIEHEISSSKNMTSITINSQIQNERIEIYFSNGYGSLSWEIRA